MNNVKISIISIIANFLSWYDNIIEDLLSGLPDKTLSLHTRWILKHRQKEFRCKGLFAELPRYKFQASIPTHLKRLST